jgi:hypothetical protein
MNSRTALNEQLLAPESPIQKTRVNTLTADVEGSKRTPEIDSNLWLWSPDAARAASTQRDERQRAEAEYESKASVSSTKKGASALLKSLRTGELSQVVDTMENEASPKSDKFLESPRKLQPASGIYDGFSEAPSPIQIDATQEERDKRQALESREEAAEPSPEPDDWFRTPEIISNLWPFSQDAAGTASTQKDEGQRAEAEHESKQVSKTNMSPQRTQKRVRTQKRDVFRKVKRAPDEKDADEGGTMANLFEGVLW